MIHDMMPGTEEQLKKEMTTAYVGIDPTADSLHIGHLVGIMMLRHLQRSGHKPIALIGGATGMIGDPSLKSGERNLLDEGTLRHNQEGIGRQLAKLLDFERFTYNWFLSSNSQRCCFCSFRLSALKSSMCASCFLMSTL
jgi:tyrosyl-tRNA synthetase